MPARQRSERILPQDPASYVTLRLHLTDRIDGEGLPLPVKFTVVRNQTRAVGARKLQHVPAMIYRSRGLTPMPGSRSQDHSDHRQMQQIRNGKRRMRMTAMNRIERAAVEPYQHG